ncbi:MAG: hypothetical protein KC619_25220 [Myxococcales bacterium]|nr:hypothetical protein [Myxococcales bacterium]
MAQGASLIVAVILPMNTVSQDRVWLFVGAAGLAALSLATGAVALRIGPKARRTWILLLGILAAIVIIVQILNLQALRST